MARSLDVLRFRVRLLLRRSRADAELDRELREHLERQVEEYVARGMAPDDARRAALATLRRVQNIRVAPADARRSPCSAALKSSTRKHATRAAWPRSGVCGAPPATHSARCCPSRCCS